MTGVGPRLVSNATPYVLRIHGEKLPAGSRLSLGRPIELELPTTAVDEGLLLAELPAIALAADIAVAVVPLRVLLPDGRELPVPHQLAIANDARYPSPRAVATSEGRAFALSTTTDELFAWAPGGTSVTRSPLGDGPVAIAAIDLPEGPRLAVLHDAAGELWLLDPAAPAAPLRRFPVGPDAAGLLVDAAADRFFVTNRRTESIATFALSTGARLAEQPAGVDPTAIAQRPDGARLVAARGSEELQYFPAGGGAPTSVEVGPGARLLGGHTAPFAPYVMGDKAARALVADPLRPCFYASSIGPSIGPNPDRMEVSMNGGISVISADGRFLRHVSLREGLPEGLALDVGRGLLFAADVATGRIVVLDAEKLCGSDEEAASALLGAQLLAPLSGRPRVRPDPDLARPGKATASLHVGPWALALEGETLTVLARLDGTLRRFDTSLARSGRLAEQARVELPGFEAQRNRRTGEVLFFTDLGQTRMTCDACHPDGHTGGVIYEKTQPLRIYRATSLRGARDSAPYFTPSMLPSLRHMSRDVLGRNRFHDPEPTAQEIAMLASYVEALAPRPNPWLRAGAWPARIALPGGGEGDPREGLRLFRLHDCGSCHPMAQGTTDQDDATRGRLHAVGTPRALPLRPQWQDPSEPGWPPPSLVGVWDAFPLLGSGAGGLGVAGDRLVVTTTAPLGQVLDGGAYPTHGALSKLSRREQDDLHAFLLTL